MPGVPKIEPRKNTRVKDRKLLTTKIHEEKEAMPKLKTKKRIHNPKSKKLRNSSQNNKCGRP